MLNKKKVGRTGDADGRNGSRNPDQQINRERGKQL